MEVKTGTSAGPSDGFFPKKQQKNAHTPLSSIMNESSQSTQALMQSQQNLTEQWTTPGNNKNTATETVTLFTSYL